MALIKISVKNYKENKLFFLEDTSSRTVYFESLCAVHFEGYQTFDQIRLIRAGNEISTGSIMYMGTHAASEYFCHLNGVDRQFKLYPKDFEIGDIIEIETERYASADALAKILVMTDNLDTALRSAFAENNNSLNNVQLTEAIESGIRSGKQDLSEQDSFILHHV